MREKLWCKISETNFKLSDIWQDEEMKTMSQDEIKELVREDLLSFLEDLPKKDILSICDFYWARE